MKYAKFFPIIILLLLALISFGIWQGRSKQTVNTSSKSQDTAQTNNQNTNTTSSFIEQLRQRDYKGGEITIEETISDNDSYTGYIFSYPSDGLTIYGRMNIPKEDRPADGFPVIILNHGYFNQSSFQSGDGTQTMADILASQGYLTLASDYRGFGRSENDSQGSRGHNPNYAIDVLNLIASLGSLDKVDRDRVGMWGHSMGGEVSIRSVEVADQIKAVVLWAPTSTNQGTNAAFYGGGRHSAQNKEDAHNDSDLQYIKTPISLHQGLSDTEVDPEWSKELNSDLEKIGKQIEYFEYEGQDHNFRNLGWDVISERTIGFFDKFLKKPSQ